MKTLDNFLKNQKPIRRKSKLKKYEKEIKELHAKGYRVEQIQQFLLENQIKADRSYIFKFLKLNKNLNRKSFSFKSPIAPKAQKKSIQKRESGGEDKAMAAFFSNCQKTADSIKNYNKENQE